MNPCNIIYSELILVAVAILHPLSSVGARNAAVDVDGCTPNASNAFTVCAAVSTVRAAAYVVAVAASDKASYAVAVSVRDASAGMVSSQRIHQALNSLSGNTSDPQISWSREAAILDVMMILWLWNLTGISAALLPKCLSNVRENAKV